MKKRIVRLGLSVAVFILLTVAATVGYRYALEVFDGIRIPAGTVSFIGNYDVSDHAGEIIVPAKDFSFTDMNGNSVKLSDFYGKPVVMIFWASWCESCREELAVLETVYAEYREDVTFLVIDFVDGTRETEETARKFVYDRDYSFPIYFDVGKSGKTEYNVPTIPFTVFICADGNIHRIRKGEMQKSEFADYVKEITVSQTHDPFQE